MCMCASLPSHHRDDAADVVLADPSMLIPAEGGSTGLWDESSTGGPTDSSRGLPVWAGGAATASSPAAQTGRDRRRKAGGRVRRREQGVPDFGSGTAAESGGKGPWGESERRGEGLPGGGAVSSDAQAIAAAALDEIIMAESQGANRTRRSRSRKNKDQQ